MLCQNTCDVPLGMTAIVVLPASAGDDELHAPTASDNSATEKSVFFILVPAPIVRHSGCALRFPIATNVPRCHPSRRLAPREVRLPGIRREAPPFAGSRQPPCTPASQNRRAVDARRSIRT